MSTWINKVREFISYLLSEDATFLLLEDGGKIITDSGSVWTNVNRSMQSWLNNDEF